MHISDLHDYTPAPTGIVEEFLAKGRKKQLKKEIEQLVDDEFERLQEFGEEYISQTAAYRAEKFLERVIRGDEEAGMALLGDKTGGSRYRQHGCDAAKPWASLIHGRLFETDEIRLRRQIVEAHAELLQNERIKDLESIVDGLTNQIRSLEDRLKKWKGF